MGLGGHSSAVDVTGHIHLSFPGADGAVRQSQRFATSGKWELIAKTYRSPTENAVVCNVGANSSSETLSGSLSVFNTGKLAFYPVGRVFPARIVTHPNAPCRWGSRFFSQPRPVALGNRDPFLILR